MGGSLTLNFFLFELPGLRFVVVLTGRIWNMWQGRGRRNRKQRRTRMRRKGKGKGKEETFQIIGLQKKK